MSPVNETTISEDRQGDQQLQQCKPPSFVPCLFRSPIACRSSANPLRTGLPVSPDSRPASDGTSTAARSAAAHGSRRWWTPMVKFDAPGKPAAIVPDCSPGFRVLLHRSEQDAIVPARFLRCADGQARVFQRRQTAMSAPGANQGWQALSPLRSDETFRSLTAK